MKWPEIRGYEPDKGDYLVIADYDCEGLCIVGQGKTAAEGVEQLAGGYCTAPQILVKVVSLEVSDKHQETTSEGDSK